MNKKQNKSLGVVWLKFYCFVRPWISFFLMLMTIINVIGYEEYKNLYFSSSWGYLQFGFSLANTIMLINLFFMAKKKDNGTIGLIKWILIFETISFSYQTALNQAKEIDMFFGLFIIYSIILFFLWYKTNMKYFNKRKHLFNVTNNLAEEENDDELEDIENEQEDIKEKVIAAKKCENKKVTIKTKYCKNCGGKLDLNKKCKKCGKQYFNLKISNRNAICIAIGILAITNVVTLMMYLDKKNDVEKCIDNEEFNQSKCEIIMDALSDGKSWTYTRDKLEFYDENIVFVIKGYGNYYYSYDCVQKITDGEYTFWAYNKEAAVLNGYQEGTCY